MIIGAADEQLDLFNGPAAEARAAARAREEALVAIHFGTAPQAQRCRPSAAVEVELLAVFGADFEARAEALDLTRTG